MTAICTFDKGEPKPKIDEEKLVQESIKKMLSEVFGAPKEERDKENKEYKAEEESSSNEEEDIFWCVHSTLKQL